MLASFVYDAAMGLLTISEVAGQAGLRPSAIRYYEQIGLLPAAQRISGQRRYDVTVMHRLVVIQRAQQTGFSLEEIRKLFFGFRAGTTPSARWRKLKKQKMAELDALLEHIQTMRKLVEEQGHCSCPALEECGKRMFEKGCMQAGKTPARKPGSLLRNRLKN